MAPVPATAPKPSSRDRFYTIEGQRLPSVTTVLDIIAKPALGPWYAKEERRYFETAMLEVPKRARLPAGCAQRAPLTLTTLVTVVSGIRGGSCFGRGRRGHCPRICR